DCIAQSEKSVRESGRNPKLPSISRFQRDTKPPPVVGGRAAKIDRDIEDYSAHNVNELALWLFELEMQPAKHILRRPTVTVLREMRRQSQLIKLVLVEYFCEESTRIGIYGRMDDPNVG